MSGKLCHGKVVHDEQVRKPQPDLEIHQEVEHLRLDWHIQCRYRFVKHDNLGVEG